MAKNRHSPLQSAANAGHFSGRYAITKKTTIRNPGNAPAGMRRKQSEYATQLNEKQKLKFIYGVLEHQHLQAILIWLSVRGHDGRKPASSAGASSR